MREGKDEFWFYRTRRRVDGWWYNGGMANWEQYECPDCGRRWNTGLGEYPLFSWRNAQGECWHEEPATIAAEPRRVRDRMVSSNGT